MQYNFDEIIEREGTSTYKHENRAMYFGSKDVLPLWVADMDFASPKFVRDAIQERLNHPVLGYTVTNDEFFAPIQKWIQDNHNWEVERPWMHYLSGVVPGLSISILALTNPGDKVLIQSPVYMPFFSVIRSNNRELINNQLVEKNGRLEIDFDDFEEKAKSGVKLFLFCNPHNPGGMVWSKEDLVRISEICEKYNIIVVSDEIHCDLALPGYKYTPYATVSEAAKNHSITLIAPSKTFNIAGLCVSSFIIPNSTIRKPVFGMLQQLQTGGHGTIFGYTASTAAYSANGREWLNQLLDYLQGNIDYVLDFIKEFMPKLKPMKPEASFLIWIDFKGLGMSDKQNKSFLVEKAGLGLNHGPTFGPGGEGFQRLNIGVPRSVLEKAMQKLLNAYRQL